MKAEKKITPSVVIAVTLALYGIYMWLWVNPSLYLIIKYREFFTDKYFFREFFDGPGEPAEYLARLWTQFYNYPMVASLLIVLCLVATFFLIVNTLKRTHTTPWISFVPVFILLLMHNDYRHAILFDIHILLLCKALFVFAVFIKYSRVRMYVCFSLLLAILLYVNGLVTAITFTVTAMILLGLQKEKAVTFLWITFIAVVVFVLFYVVFSLSFLDLKQELTDITGIYSFRYYPIFLFTSVAVLPFLNRPVHVRPILNKACFLLFTPAVFLILYFTTVKEERASLQIQHYAVNEDWKTTLKLARNCKYPDKNTAYYTHQALYHTGRIYDELFSYYQGYGSQGLLLSEMGAYSEFVPNQRTFLQVGALSLSVIWGTEATNIYGANPYVLRPLTKAYLAEGNIREANKVLNLLEKTLFQKEWVKKYRAIARDTSLIRTDAELNKLRNAQTPIATVPKQSPLTNLFLLSRDTNLNKMAYDYMLVGAMLDHQIETFTMGISRLKEFGYKQIPKLYMEGLVYNALYSSSPPIDLRDFSYDRSIILRFYEFRSELMTMMQNRPYEAQNILKAKFGDTYWYYLFFESQLKDSDKSYIFKKLASLKIQ